MVFIHSLKDILSIKVKTRHDGFCDQYNRMFMTKLLLIMSVIMSFDYFADQISCIVADDAKKNLQKEFVHSACWISGLYVFEEMKTRLDKSDYYGIPAEIEHNGIDNDGQLCQMKPKGGVKIPGCTPMTRVYYLQYQWMPFYIGACAIFYYMPYMVFRIINSDIISLRTSVKSATFGDTDGIIKNYFDAKINPVFHQRLRVWWNIFVKSLYVFVSVATFYMTDYLLLGNFLTYGMDYLSWSKNSTSQHNGVRMSGRAKAGNVLLPSMGFCDIFESTKDSLHSRRNAHKFICEISPNILYQYILMILWFFFLVSITISLLGMISYVVYLSYHMVFHSSKTIFHYITLRQVEYLDAIKGKNMILYGDVMRKLREKKGNASIDHHEDKYKMVYNVTQCTTINNDATTVRYQSRSLIL